MLLLLMMLLGAALLLTTTVLLATAASTATTAAVVVTLLLLLLSLRCGGLWALLLLSLPSLLSAASAAATSAASSSHSSAASASASLLLLLLLLSAFGVRRLGRSLLHAGSLARALLSAAVRLRWASGSSRRGRRCCGSGCGSVLRHDDEDVCARATSAAPTSVAHPVSAAPRRRRCRAHSRACTSSLSVPSLSALLSCH